MHGQLDVNNMGSQWSQLNTSGGPIVNRSEWRETPMPIRNCWRVSHGYYRLFEKVLTGERMEQHSLAFQEESQYEKYLESFHWRRQEPYLVPAISIERNGGKGLCGGRMKATLSLPHIPRRLSNIQQVSVPQGLYILGSVLCGFQKIFEAIGYLRVNEEMVGISAEGSVLVWLSANFSSNYLYGPHYVEPEGMDGKDEESMVRQIIDMIERKIDFCQQEGEESGRECQKFGQFVNGVRINFESAQHAIREYADHYQLAIPQCLHGEQGWGVAWGRSDSNTPNTPLHPSYLRHQQQRSTHITSNIPQMESSHHTPSQQHHFTSLPAIEKEDMRQGQGDTTGDTAMAGREMIHPPLGTYLPRINFNYGLTRQECYKTPSPSQHSTLRNSLATPHFTLPLTLIPEKQQKPQRAQTKRVTFVDKEREHCLDDELVEDLGRYFP